MTHNILSISISIVAFESIFSIDEQILDKFHSALKLDIAKTLIYTQN